MAVSDGELAGDGCAVWAHCLSCPLPACLQEFTAAEQAQIHARAMQLARATRIRRLAVQGVGAAAIAQRMQLSLRVVYAVAQAEGIVFCASRAPYHKGLTAVDWRRIAERWLGGETQARLARDYGVTETHIGRGVRVWVRRR